MASKQTRTALPMPRNILRRSNGFAIDMGSSLIKLIYLAKDEWETSSSSRDENSDGNGTVYMTSFPLENVQEVIAFIKESVFIRRVPDPCPVIHTTGVGLIHLADTFTSELKIKIKNIFECDDFVHGAQFLLENYDMSEVCITPPESAFKEGVRIGQSICQASKSFAKSPLAKWRVNDKYTEEYEAYCEKILSGTYEELCRELEYPFLLYQMGSGFPLLKVFKDGSYDLADMNSIAGRTFLVLGRLLTGAKTFEELAALAEAGHEDKLNVRMSDVVTGVEEDSYDAFRRSEMVIFAFAKASGKKLEDIDKADLARTLLQMICYHAMNMAHHVMHKENIRHVFLAGSFPQVDLIRRLLVKEFEVSRGLHTYRPTQENHLHIFSHAGCIGTLGSFVAGCEANSQDAETQLPT